MPLHTQTDIGTHIYIETHRERIHRHTERWRHTQRKWILIDTNTWLHKHTHIKRGIDIHIHMEIHTEATVIHRYTERHTATHKHTCTYTERYTHSDIDTHTRMETHIKGTDTHTH